MTVVLVHGNPETDAVWDPLVAELGRDDVIRLSPPGFGAPLPDGWPGTYLDYRDWLCDELARIDGPIDVVGHDWGGNHVVNAVMHRPDLVRSWASDTLGVFDREYAWNDVARIWQTPVDGEALVEAMLGGTVENRVRMLANLGVGHEVGAAIAAGQGPEMGQALLLLYRSAVPSAWAGAGRHLERAAARPGLSLVATEDPYVGSVVLRRRAADRAGAQTALLDGLGHWWMVEDPARGAAALTGFWNLLAP